jgi:hypothetical protein
MVIRAEIEQVSEEYRAVEAAPAPSKDLKSRALAILDELSERGKPHVYAMSRTGDPLGLVEKMRLQSLGVTAGPVTQAHLQDWSRDFLCWALHDVIGGAVVALGPLGFAVAGVSAGVTGLAAAFRLLTGAMLANPIGLIITGLTVLAYLIYSNWDAVKKWAANSIEAFGRMVTFFMQLPGQIGSAIADAASGLYDAGVNLISQLWEGMKAKFSALLGWVSGIGSSIAGAVGLGGGSSSGGTRPPGRAMGGNVTRGRAYVVGERRRELFVPGMSGTIHPTTDIGGRSGATVTVHNTINVSGVGDPETVA